jgi:hypothetical protein
LIAHFATLDAGPRDVSHPLMWGPPVRHPKAAVAQDPLEQLWRLPARQPHTPS